MSASIDIQVEGIAKAIKGLRAWQVQKRAGVVKALDITARNIERKAKRKAPVNKQIGAGGRLRSSIDVRRTGVLTRDVGAGVASNVEYGAFVEYGTGRRGAASNVDTPAHYEYGSKAGMAAQPYLTPAWQGEKSKYIRRVKAVLSDASTARLMAA